MISSTSLEPALTSLGKRPMTPPPTMVPQRYRPRVFGNFVPVLRQSGESFAALPAGWRAPAPRAGLSGANALPAPAPGCNNGGGGVLTLAAAPRRPQPARRTGGKNDCPTQNVRPHVGRHRPDQGARCVAARLHDGVGGGRRRLHAGGRTG